MCTILLAMHDSLYSQAAFAVIVSYNELVSFE